MPSVRAEPRDKAMVDACGAEGPCAAVEDPLALGGSDAPASRARSGILVPLARLVALQDAMLLAYLAVTGAMVWAAKESPLKPGCARVAYVSIAIHSTACFVSRGLTGLPSRVRAVIYRASIVGVLISSYLTLRNFLQLVRTDALDDRLVRLDLTLFGVGAAPFFVQRKLIVALKPPNARGFVLKGRGRWRSGEVHPEPGASDDDGAPRV